jgi:hypothetical protein
MASAKGRDGLQDLMCHIYCRCAILTRYHRPYARSGCVKKRFKLELERFFVSTLILLNLDGRPLPGIRRTSANHPLSSLEID